MSCQIALAEFGEKSEEARLLLESHAGTVLVSAVEKDAGFPLESFPRVRAFSSLAEAFFAFPSLEAVAIPSPGEDAVLFSEAVLLSLSHGKHVFAVLPPSVSPEKLDVFFAEAKKSGCLFWPFLPGIGSASFKDVRQRIEDGEAGELLLIRETGLLSRDFRDPADAIRAALLPSFLRNRVLLGKLLSLSALAERSGESRSRSLPVPDVLTVDAKYSSGALYTGVFAVPFRGADGFSPDVVFRGSEGEIVPDPAMPENVFGFSDYSEAPPAPESDLLSSLRHFLDSLSADDPASLLPGEASFLKDAVNAAASAASSALCGGVRKLFDPASF